MAKVLIISDNHGLTKELELIKERHQVDGMIHCGDSELEFDAPEMAGFHKVIGNCDDDSRYPQQLIVEISGLRFFIVHGHHHNVKRDLATLSDAAEESGAHIVCFGHSHIAEAKKYGDVLMINPGSVFRSKSDDAETYAIVEWQTLADLQVQYYTIDGKLLREINL